MGSAGAYSRTPSSRWTGVQSKGGEAEKTAKIPPRIPPARMRGRSRWPDSRPGASRAWSSHVSASLCPSNTAVMEATLSVASGTGSYTRVAHGTPRSSPDEPAAAHRRLEDPATLRPPDGPGEAARAAHRRRAERDRRAGLRGRLDRVDRPHGRGAPPGHLRPLLQPGATAPGADRARRGIRARPA